LPVLGDEEVLTMESCGEYFTLTANKDLWQYFRRHARQRFLGLENREALGKDGRGLGPADTGGIEARPQVLLTERYAMVVVTPPRARMQSAHPHSCTAWGGSGSESKPLARM
jgi:hypothetical protein